LLAFRHPDDDALNRDQPREPLLRTSGAEAAAMMIGSTLELGGTDAKVVESFVDLESDRDQPASRLYDLAATSPSTQTSIRRRASP
jgi:hypothetical protein